MAQPPVKVNMWTDPLGWLRETAEENAANAGTDQYGRPNDPGWLNDTIGNLTNATDEGTKAYRDAKTNQENKGVWKPQLEQVGLTWEEEMTPAQAQQKIKDKKLQDSIKLTQKKEDLKFNNPTAADNRMRADRQFYAAQKSNAQARLDLLASTERSERREDRRYNERLELESKKDRRQAMQNLAAGLASLGAAFAL